MAIFLSAGHTPKGPYYDPGAVSGGVKEADLTMDLRNLIATELSAKKANVKVDKDTESLAQYIGRIEPGSGSVVCDLHYNAAANPKATGVECVVPARHTTAEWNCAKELAAVVSKHTGIRLRGNNGVITEADTARGRLAIMREDGLNVLLEVCFITNPSDMAAYRKNKEIIAKDIARVLMKYDAMFS